MTDIDKIKAALEPFAIYFQDHVPDDHVVHMSCWTAGHHRAVCEALELLPALSAKASRVAELEAEVARLTKECEEAFSEGYGCGANNAAH